MKHLKKFKLKKLIIGIIIFVVLLTALSIAGKNYIIPKIKELTAARRMKNFSTTTTASTEKVATKDIEKTLTSSGTIEPINTYKVTTLAEGEIIAADFEEGDTVKEGQVLYKISTDTLDNKIDSANTTVTRAENEYKKSQQNYEDAVADYNEAKQKYNEASTEYGNPSYKSEVTGYIKTLYVKAGDKIQNGTKIADIYDNSSMLLYIPFTSSEVSESLVGKTAKVTLTGSQESLTGKVTKVSNIEEALSGNRVVKYVTIKVTNPGSISTSSTATASIGSIYSSSTGTFSVLTDTTITSDVAGEIKEVKVNEGDKISDGDTIFVMTEDSIDDILSSYQSQLDNAETAVENSKDSVEKAKESVEDAESSLGDIIDTKTDYSITSPVDGQVITKTSLVGDTISNNNNNSLCTIYDLSKVKFEMKIDELDILNVKVGQEVEVTADALDGVTITGTVTNISLAATTSQGVTDYPVTVTINDPGDLLPGMNVTGKIVLEKVTGVLAIPSDALMRNNVVYVKDASVKEAVGDVPAGYKSVEVETGLSDGDYIEIKSGLTEGEEVYVKRTSDASAAMQNMMPGGQGGQGFPGGNMNRDMSGGTGGFPGQ